MDARQIFGLLLILVGIILAIITFISIASTASWWIWALFIATLVFLALVGLLLFLDINSLEGKLKQLNLQKSTTSETAKSSEKDHAQIEKEVS